MGLGFDIGLRAAPIDPRVKAIIWVLHKLHEHEEKEAKRKKFLIRRVREIYTRLLHTMDRKTKKIGRDAHKFQRSVDDLHPAARDFFNSIHFDVHGHEEVAKGFDRLSSELPRAIQKALADVTAELEADAQDLAARHHFSTPTVRGFQGVRPMIGLREVGFVRQTRGRTTGKRPDFAAIQGEFVLDPLVRKYERRAIKAVDKAVETTIRRAGF